MKTLRSRGFYQPFFAIISKKWDNGFCKNDKITLSHIYIYTFQTIVFVYYLNQFGGLV